MTEHAPTKTPADRKRSGHPEVLPGGFISHPEAFPDAPPSLRDVLKLWYRPTTHDGSVGLEFSTDAVLVDFSDVEPSLIDAKAIAADCDLVKRIATTHPHEIQQLLQDMQRGTREGVESAERIAAKIGLTESDAVKSGGGFFFLVIVVALALGSAGCGAGLKEKASSASTTPKSHQ